jgi:hypothetical protein
MQFFLLRKAVAAAGLLLPVAVQAQFTETFESVTINPADTLGKRTSFTSNGQAFNLITNNCATGGTFGVFIPNQWVQPCNGGSLGHNNAASYGVGTSCTGGTCTGVSPKFIDNTGIGFGNPYGTSQIYSIKTANAALFTVKTLFLYLSANSGTSPSDGGGVTFRGKVNGTTVFTFVKTTGFNLSFATNNGFTYIDFGAYATTNINELEIQGGATANYVAIDNFTFGASVPLPVTLSAFDAVNEGGRARLNWTAAAEVNFAYYDIERSLDGNVFDAIGQVQATGKGTYQYYDPKPVEGKNFYRLRMVDIDGRDSYSPVADLTLNHANVTAAYLFPNPAKGVVKLYLPQAYTAAMVDIMDLSGRLLQHTRVDRASAALSLSGINTGLYLFRITATDGTLLGTGKITVK